MSSCIPVCTGLLGSKVNTDVLESLEFLATAVEFKVQGSREGVRKALPLVWSKEQQIKDNVVQVYLRLYLHTEVSGLYTVEPSNGYSGKENFVHCLEDSLHWR